MRSKGRELDSQRFEARKKGRVKRGIRVVITCSVFVLAFVGIFWGVIRWAGQNEQVEHAEEGNSDLTEEKQSKIEIYDEDGGITGGVISSRMEEWIYEVDSDLRELGYKPVKAVLPTGTIREVDFYLDEIKGYIKTTIDRGSGVTAEDVGRMLKYLEGIGATEFSYIDVRVEGKGFWK